MCVLCVCVSVCLSASPTLGPIGPKLAVSAGASHRPQGHCFPYPTRCPRSCGRRCSCGRSFCSRRHRCRRSSCSCRRSFALTTQFTLGLRVVHAICTRIVSVLFLAGWSRSQFKLADPFFSRDAKLNHFFNVFVGFFCSYLSSVRLALARTWQLLHPRSSP